MDARAWRIVTALLLAMVVLPLAQGENKLKSPGSLPTKNSLTSSRGFYRLTMQQDCNLVLYKAPLHDVVWASNTNLAGTGCYAKMQVDGNLVIYDSAGSVKWASNTNGTPAKFELVVQNDARLAIYNVSTGQRIWSSRGSDAE